MSNLLIPPFTSSAPTAAVDNNFWSGHETPPAESTAQTAPPTQPPAIIYTNLSTIPAEAGPMQVRAISGSGGSSQGVLASAPILLPGVTPPAVIPMTHKPFTGTIPHPSVPGQSLSIDPLRSVLARFGATVFDIFDVHEFVNGLRSNGTDKVGSQKLSSQSGAGFPRSTDAAGRAGEIPTTSLDTGLSFEGADSDNNSPVRTPTLTSAIPDKPAAGFDLSGNGVTGNSGTGAAAAGRLTPSSNPASGTGASPSGAAGVKEYSVTLGQVPLEIEALAPDRGVLKHILMEMMHRWKYDTIFKISSLAGINGTRTRGFEMHRLKFSPADITANSSSTDVATISNGESMNAALRELISKFHGSVVIDPKARRVYIAKPDIIDSPLDGPGGSLETPRACMLDAVSERTKDSSRRELGLAAISFALPTPPTYYRRVAGKQVPLALPLLTALPVPPGAPSYSAVSGGQPRSMQGAPMQYATGAPMMMPHQPHAMYYPPPNQGGYYQVMQPAAHPMMMAQQQPVYMVMGPDGWRQVNGPPAGPSQPQMMGGYAQQAPAMQWVPAPMPPDPFAQAPMYVHQQPVMMQQPHGGQPPMTTGSQWSTGVVPAQGSQAPQPRW